MTQETKTFGAEAGKILHLMIHSLYSSKEIFLRELISNASDACDKLRYLSQVNPSLLTYDVNLKITVRVDKENKQIIIRDNGIGMNKEDLIENLGTIAKSGTQNFLQSLSGDAKKDSMLIGQFGVGFYSAFMVADSITVTSRKAGEEKSYIWSSNGLGEYTISDFESTEEFTRGTEVVIRVKEKESSYLEPYRLKHIVKTYSDHIAIPIYFINAVSLSTANNDINTDTDANPSHTPHTPSSNEEQLNSSSAIWTRPKSEVTPEQYKEFFNSLSYAGGDPWLTVHNKNEGVVEFTNLLFIPSHKPFDLFNADRKSGIKLYIKRVFISDEKIDLVPHYLRFISGIVDSEDLPLNISRETLQHNSILEKIKVSITKRVLAELHKKKTDASTNGSEEYLNFWNNFGSVLKEGLCEPSSEAQQLLELSMFRSAIHDKMISLDEYINTSHNSQKTIYYLSGSDFDKLKSSPLIEGFLSKGIDVVLLTDAVDNFWVSHNSKYNDYEIKSVTRSDIDLENITSENKTTTDIETGTEERLDTNTANKNNNTNNTEYTKLLEYFKEVLGSSVRDVKISKKLTKSIACLAVSDAAMDINLERLLIEKQRDKSRSSTAKILEINPKHEIIEKINHDLSLGHYSNDNSELIKLIFDQACIIQGEPVHDASAFSNRLSNILRRTLVETIKATPQTPTDITTHEDTVGQIITTETEKTSTPKLKQQTKMKSQGKSKSIKSSKSHHGDKNIQE